MTAVGTAVGFRFHAGPAAAAGAIGLALLVGLAFSWINALIGLLVRDPEAAGLAGLLPVIALVFTSSTFVPAGRFRPIASRRVRLPQVERIAASGYVVLYLSLPGVVVTWFVTASARQEKRQVSYL